MVKNTSSIPPINPGSTYKATCPNNGQDTLPAQADLPKGPAGDVKGGPVSAVPSGRR